MDLPGLSDEPAAGSVATRKSSGARDRNARRTHRGVVRSDPARASQGRPISARGADRSGDDADFSLAAAETADQRQAEYFMRLLAQSRRLSEHRIGQYHKAIAASEASGDVEAAASFRRLVHIEEQDRQIVDGLMEKLRRRFTFGAPGEVPAISRKTRVTAR